MLTHAPSETLILRPDPAGAGVNGAASATAVAASRDRRRDASASPATFSGDTGPQPGNSCAFHRIRCFCVVRSR